MVTGKEPDSVVNTDRYAPAYLLGSKCQAMNDATCATFWHRYPQL